MHQGRGKICKELKIWRFDIHNFGSSALINDGLFFSQTPQADGIYFKDFGWGIFENNSTNGTTLAVTWTDMLGTGYQ